jgi:hypothetical protein
MLILPLLMGNVLAQESPIARVKVTPQTVSVGESAELKVTVLVPTWFPRPPVFPPFELANAITRLPPDSAYPVSERIGRETWSGITRNYRVYPLLGATFRITDETIRVTYANPGGPPVTTDVAVPEIVLRSSVPAGAESLDPYLAGRSLTLSLRVDGELESLQVGDALVVTYGAELDGLPAIFIPPLAPQLSLEGVSIYADEPDLEDGPLARRSEKLTLVFNGGGDFAVPGRSVDFWNTATGAVETAAVAGISVSVAGPPVTAVAPAVAARSWQQIASVFAGLLVLLILARWCIPVATARYRSASARRKESEAFAFREFRRALQSRNARAAYHAMLVWLDRLAPKLNARNFAQESGDPDFSRGVEVLIRGLYNEAGTAVDFDQLVKAATHVRRRHLSQAPRESRYLLPPLNP